MTSGQFTKLTIRDVPIAGKTILVRVDFDTPPTKDGRVDDDSTIRMSLPTIRQLLRDKCKIIVISHFGHPGGKRDEAYSLEPAALRLAELLGQPVRFVDDCIGYKVKMAIKRAPKTSVTVLENLQFHPGEAANDMAFAQRLATDTSAELFVQDAFAVARQTYASTAAITQFLPSVAGLSLEHEYRHTERQPRIGVHEARRAETDSSSFPGVESLLERY